MASHVKQLLSYIRWTRLHEDISHWDYMVFTPCQLRIKDSQIQFEKLILGITITWNLALYSQHPVPLIPTFPLSSRFVPFFQYPSLRFYISLHSLSDTLFSLFHHFVLPQPHLRLPLSCYNQSEEGF